MKLEQFSRGAFLALLDFEEQVQHGLQVHGLFHVLGHVELVEVRLLLVVQPVRDLTLQCRHAFVGVAQAMGQGLELDGTSVLSAEGVASRVMKAIKKISHPRKLESAFRIGDLRRTSNNHFAAEIRAFSIRHLVVKDFVSVCDLSPQAIPFQLCNVSS